MSKVIEPVEELRGLFLWGAEAVLRTQLELDARLALLSATRPPQQLAAESHYAIPRTVIELSFGLQAGSRGPVILPFLRGDEKRELHEHRMRFSIISVPEQPPPLPRGAMDAAVEPTFQLIQPHFFVPLFHQPALKQRLINALKSKRWSFALPKGSEMPDEADVWDEADAIDKADGKDPERGLVMFQLDSRPVSYLIVRVTDKSKKDGVFVLTPDGQPEVMIYSFEDDGVDNIVYQPLHDFARTVRRWLGGADAARVDFRLEEFTATAELGISALARFASEMAQGFTAGLEFLSGTQWTQPLPQLPTFYDISDVEAELGYSVYFNNAAQKMEFSFGQRVSPEGEETLDEIGVIESRARVRAYRLENLPRVEIELATPEFVLSGRARQLFMSAAERNAPAIAALFGKEEAELYLQLLRSEMRQRGAVIFLAYAGKTPEQKFLIIWPGAYRGEERDFVFTCELKGDDQDQPTLENISKVMGLDEDLEDVFIDFDAQAPHLTDLSQDQYTPFHNFFHAARIWRFRMGA